MVYWRTLSKKSECKIKRKSDRTTLCQQLKNEILLDITLSFKPSELYLCLVRAEIVTEHAGFILYCDTVSVLAHLSGVIDKLHSFDKIINTLLTYVY